MPVALPLRPQVNDPWAAFYPKPASDGRVKPVWTAIDVDTTPMLKQAIAQAIAARKLADEAEAEAEAEFIALMSDPPSGFAIKVGFAWGRAAWALVDKSTAKVKAAKASVAPLLRR